MKILFINDFSPNFPGSFFESLFALSRRLKDKGHNLFFVFPVERDYISQLNELGTVYYNRSFMGRKFSFSLLLMVFKLCRREKIEIVHSSFGLAGTITGSLLSGILNFRHFSHERNPSAKFINCNKLTLKKIIPGLGFKTLDLFGETTYISISNGVKESLIHYNKVNPNHIVVIPNAVLPDRKNPLIDLDEFEEFKKMIKNKFVIGMTAHLGPQKDHRTLVDAASILVKKIPDVIFILIGGNLVLDKHNFREGIENYIKGKGLESNFYFVGEVVNPFPYIELLNVGCLISNFEGFGNALVEYMLKKKPIIGTSVGGIKDIIEDGYNGFLVPPKKPEVIAEKLIYFYENPEIAEEMGKRGYQKAIMEYNMDNWINRIVELYKS